MYQDQKKKDEETIGRLENELKNMPKVLNMPPLETVFGKCLCQKLFPRLKKQANTISNKTQ